MAVAAPCAILALGMNEGPDYIKIAAAVFSGLSLLVGLWIAFGRDVRRKKRLKNPAVAKFVVPTGQSGDTFYLPADAEGVLPLLITPKLNYREHTLRISFEGHADGKPLFVDRTDRFVKKWIGEKKMKRTAYVDIKETLHIDGTIDLVEGFEYAHGVVVKTRKPGKYPIKLRSYTEGGVRRIKSELTLIVTYPKAAISSSDQT